MSDDPEKKEWKLEFAPGCFDGFEGTQEELDELISTLQTKLKDGSFFEEAKPIDDEDIPEEFLEEILRRLDDDRRKLN